MSLRAPSDIALELVESLAGAADYEMCVGILSRHRGRQWAEHAVQMALLRGVLERRGDYLGTSGCER
jgi:hypothetical protein